MPPREGNPGRQAYDKFHALWDYALPDGTRYCHWGGKRLSARVAKLLNLRPRDCVLDLCCGRGGSIPFLAKARFVCGVDISLDAVRSANAWMGSPSRLCIHADAHALPFKNEFFDKIFSQDGDAWLHPTKGVLMGEIHRVTARHGLFVYQSYADSKAMPKAALTRTKALLRKCGFAHTAVVHIEDVEEMFAAAGFRVESVRSLHEVYAQDNIRMLENLQNDRSHLLKNHPARQVQSLAELIEWETRLFSEHWWTGVLLVARKAGRIASRHRTDSR